MIVAVTMLAGLITGIGAVTDIERAGAASVAVARDAGLLHATPLIPILSRDCGFTVQLSDGNVLWIFCDSFYQSNTGKLHASQSNTAAFAAAATKTTQQENIYRFYGENILNADANHWGGLSFITLPSAPANFPCTNGIRKAWPRGAVTVPNGAPGGGDRVLVYYSRICDSSATNGNFSYAHNGIGIAAFDYRPASFNPTTGPTAPIVATILNDSLFASNTPFGSGAQLAADGYLYTYFCSTVSCAAARVNPANAAIAGKYQKWNGVLWGNQSAAMIMPGTSVPMSEMTVQWVPKAGKYVMTYSECGNGCTIIMYDRLVIRTATKPAGPWSAAVEVMLPGCTQSLTDTPCNAALSHVELDSTNLAVTWSRRNEGSSPTDRLHWGTIPMNTVIFA